MADLKKRIYTVATAHLDTSWEWDLETTIREYIPKTLHDNFAMFEKYPDYKFSFEGSYRYELMEEYYPEEFEKLKEYGTECIAWYHLLVPVLDGFVRAFDQPISQENIDFWQCIADQRHLGSGRDYLSGWITAFCVFDTRADGKYRWIGPRFLGVRGYEQAL